MGWQVQVFTIGAEVVTLFTWPSATRKCKVLIKNVLVNSRQQHWGNKPTVGPLLVQNPWNWIAVVHPWSQFWIDISLRIFLLSFDTGELDGFMEIWRICPCALSISWEPPELGNTIKLKASSFSTWTHFFVPLFLTFLTEIPFFLWFQIHPRT